MMPSTASAELDLHLLHQKRGRAAFRWIVIIDSGDSDHSGDDGADRLPLTVFNRG
jgi:hypothetical protein